MIQRFSVSSCLDEAKCGTEKESCIFCADLPAVWFLCACRGADTEVDPAEPSE